MSRYLLAIFCLAASMHTFAYGETLSLKNYPSAYLQNCKGIAYIYKTGGVLNLGIRAVENCGRIKINNTVYRMEKYRLGFRYETEMHESPNAQVTLFSRRGHEDHLIVENAHRLHEHWNSETSDHRPKQHSQTKRSLAALKACSDAFQFGNLKEYCHEKMQHSHLDIAPIVRFCSTAISRQSQRSCLDDSLQFSYDPVAIMQLCADKFLFGSSKQQCIKSASQFNKPPIELLNQCANIYSRTAKRLNCIDKLSQTKNPRKQITLLTACASQFSLSYVDRCFEASRKIRKQPSKTLAACSLHFASSSDKLQCLSSSAGIRGGNAVAVVRQCADSHPQTSKRLSCIDGFSRK